LADLAVIGRRGNVIKNEFVGAFIPVTRGQFDYIANILVIAKLHTFDDTPAAHIKAGNNPSG
jgi:hypothetical protein